MSAKFLSHSVLTNYRNIIINSKKYWLRANFSCLVIKLTSTHGFGRTIRPSRPTSLAVNVFSNNGTIVEFKLEHIMSYG
jgi:hypothetical protein